MPKHTNEVIRLDNKKEEPTIGLEAIKYAKKMKKANCEKPQLLSPNLLDEKKTSGQKFCHQKILVLDDCALN